MNFLTNPKQIYVEAVPVSEQGSVSAAATEVQAIPLVQQETGINETGIRAFLTEHQWPKGLQEIFIRNLNIVPMRYFICDDSGSMSHNDGKLLVPSSDNSYRYRKCSRWTELTSALKFHADLARIGKAPSQFRFLNRGAPMMVGNTSTEEEEQGYQQIISSFNNSPSGGTPLCSHIREVVAEITCMEEILRLHNQKVAVIIATDGESSDGNIADALRPLQNLPVWVVIRLCTDSETIMNYWNQVDQEIELEIDVLDDFENEAQEITAHNSWLTYGEPLHRLREFGISFKEMDLLDEKALSLEQVMIVVPIL
jgi:hypothetical protein